MSAFSPPVEHFKHCPSCGAVRNGKPAIPFTCDVCGFVYYFNPTVAAAAIISRPDGKILCITRAKEPQKGKLAFPGGFIDIGETIEAALRRETLEEVNIEIHDIQLLCSCPNHYDYKDVSYPVLDFIFSAKSDPTKKAEALDDVDAVGWFDPNKLELNDLAFPSLREGLKVFNRIC